jgi:site-specific recombinase XerC
MSTITNPVVSLDSQRMRSMTTHAISDAQLIDQWIISLKARKLAARTVKIRRYYIERLGRRVPLTTATLDDLQGILAEHDEYKPETMKSIRSTWRGVFQWAVLTGRLATDPTLGLLPIRVPRTVPHIAPDDQVQLAINRASIRDRAMLQLARLACLRLTELTTLHTSDRHGDSIVVDGKGGKQRRVYLHPDLAATLNELEYRQGPGWYFPGMGGSHMHPMSVNKIITNLCGNNPHSLRHAGATSAYRATKDLRSVQEMLGHASLAVTQRYLHVDEDGLRAVSVATSLAA